jgi:hypothetical protein
MISPDAFNGFFAIAPIVFAIVIVVVTYMAKRHEGRSERAPISQTLACAQCGRQESRDHMVPKSTGESIDWYCSSCAGR